MLDCKNPACREIVWKPQGSPFLLCDDCATHFEQVRRSLKDAQIPFDDTKVFARGLDYYTRTVFEVRAKGLGAQDAVAAGGRYDHLVEELGGPSMGAVGFAAGIELIVLALGEGELTAPTPSRRVVYLALAQPALVAQAVRLAQAWRERGLAVMMDYDGKSLKAQLREADKAGCQLVAILGEAELKQRSMTLKDLEQGTQRTVAFDTFVEDVSQQSKPTCHH